MASLKGSQTDQNLRHAFSDEGRFNRLPPSGTRDAAEQGQHEFAAQVQAAADSDGGHLDFLAAGYEDPAAD